MIALIDLYQKELLKVNGFSPATVETYTLSINAFCRFAKNELQTNPVNVSGPQLLKWILYLKNTGIGYSRIENHHYALKSFFVFVKKTGMIDTNPAEALPLLITRRRQVTKPISAKDAFKLLNSFDQSTCCLHLLGPGPENQRTDRTQSA
jgi:integrase/recombinase XerC